MTHSRDVANNCVQASALDARYLQARDPATAGAGGSVLRNARRSILPAGRPGAVKSVSLPDVSSPINYAGRVRSVGGFSGRMKRG